LALINLASTTAFYACISLATISLYLSYLPPIFFLLLRKIRRQRTPRGPWHLGRWGIPINIFALAYALFMIIWLPFPTILPVTTNTMNYSAPVWVACLLLAMVDYAISGHKRFQLPEEVDTESE
jgi:amino acid transporter